MSDSAPPVEKQKIEGESITETTSTEVETTSTEIQTAQEEKREEVPQQQEDEIVSEGKEGTSEGQELEQQNPILSQTAEITTNTESTETETNGIVEPPSVPLPEGEGQQERNEQEEEVAVNMEHGSDYVENMENGESEKKDKTDIRSPSSRNLRLTNQDNVLKDYYHIILPSSFIVFGVLCYVVFLYIDAFDLETVDDPSYFTRMIAFLFSTAFVSICTTSFYSLWETADDPEKTASAYAATTLVFISWVAHLIIGFDLMPVVVNWQNREMQTVRSIEWLAEVFIMILIIECLKWRGATSVVCILMQTAAQFCMAIGNIATTKTYGIIFYLGAIVLLYSNITFLWWSSYKYVSKQSKTKTGLDPEVRKSWVLLNTYFMTQSALIACYVVGYMGIINGSFEAFIISGLDLLSKIIYCSILTAK